MQQRQGTPKIGSKASEAQREAWEQTSEGTDLTNTLDFWALGLFLNSSTNFCWDKFLLFKQPTLWYFVTVVLANLYTSEQPPMLWAISSSFFFLNPCSQDCWPLFQAEPAWPKARFKSGSPDLLYTFPFIHCCCVMVAGKGWWQGKGWSSNSKDSYIPLCNRLVSEGIGS